MQRNKIQARQKRHKKIRSKISGTAQKPRLVVFRSITNNYVQLIDDENGKTLASSSDIKSKKGTKTERAKIVGETIAKEAQKLNIDTCVFDRNGYKYHGRVKAIAESARQNGLKF